MNKKRSSLVRLAILMKPYAWQLILAMLCVLIVNASDLLKPFLSKIVIDDFLVGGKEQSGIYSISASA
jgi:ATP-binding cassette subfamily B protein